MVFKANLLDRKMENTAAASVEETMEPSNILSYMVKSVINQTKVPKDRAVNKTPKVERTKPSFIMGLTASQLVSRPPENNMKFRDTIPINCAILGSSKRIPPIPSEPANIPMAKKSNKVGTPNL